MDGEFPLNYQGKEKQIYDVFLNSVNLPFQDILTNLIQVHLIKYII